MTDDVVLRRMRWWDVEAVHAVEAELFPDPWSAETFWSELAHVPESRHYLVAERAGALVGYAGLVAVARQADVQTLAVARDAQGDGLGRRLLDALVAEARRRDAGELLLEVRAENEAAQALYARAGFERIAIRRGYYRPGGTDAHVLRLRLHAMDSGGRSTAGSAD
jgi:[ribosomal protein S18]-alanine N-acetyltransferase